MIRVSNEFVWRGVLVLTSKVLTIPHAMANPEQPTTTPIAKLASSIVFF